MSQALPNGTCPFAFDNSTNYDATTTPTIQTDPPVLEEPIAVSVLLTDSPQDDAVVTATPSTAEPVPSSSTSNLGTLFLLATTTTYSVFLAAVLSFA